MIQIIVTLEPVVLRCLRNGGAFMRNMMQQRTAAQLKLLLVDRPCPDMVDLLHRYELKENVAVEMITALEPDQAAAMRAVLELIDAQLAVTLELTRHLKG